MEDECILLTVTRVMWCLNKMGSGTVGVACVRTGRHYVGFEIEPAYCELAEGRIEVERTLIEKGLSNE